MTGHGIRYSANTRIHDKPPSWREEYASGWERVEGPLEGLLELIGRGVAFSPAAMDSGHRTSDAFVSADLAVVDIDTGLSLDGFRAHPLAPHAAALYTTASHRDEPGRHRFRVIFRLRDRITDPELYKALVTLLIRELGGDRNCTDPCRLFYGNSTGIQELLSTEATLPDEWIQKAEAAAEELRRRFETAGGEYDELDLLQAAHVLDNDIIEPTADGERDRFIRVTAAAASAGEALYPSWSDWASRGHHGKGKNSRQTSERFFRGFSGRSTLATLFYLAGEANPDWRKGLPDELRKPYEGGGVPGYSHDDFMGDPDLPLDSSETAAEKPPSFNVDPRAWGDWHREAQGESHETQEETEPQGKRDFAVAQIPRPSDEELKDPITLIKYRLDLMYPRLRLNLLTLNLEYGPADQPKVAEDLTTAYVRISRATGQTQPKTLVYDTAQVIATERAYNPVTSYLERCSKLKPIEYFNEIATELLGVPPEGDDNPRMPDGQLYANVVMRRFLVAAVARALNPGCSMPWMPILQGSQNVGKTNFLSYLTPPDPVSATHVWCPTIQASLATLREKPHILHAGWIVLLDEAERYFQRRYVEDLKNLISVSSDKSSPKYQEQKTFHRAFVLAGATNSANFLVDPTGNRRFLPIRVLGKVPAPEDNSIRIIDLDRVKLDRDRIWAAAYQAYMDGATWEFSSYELSHLQGYTESFMVDQPLTQALTNTLDKGCTFVYEGRPAWTTTWICEQLELRIDAGIATSKAISSEMARLGYENIRRRVAGRALRFWIKPLTAAEAHKAELSRQLGLG